MIGEHSFLIEDAVKYGVEKAIVLKNLRFWLEKNAANGRHVYDGYYWTYNSAKAFARLFPYWSADKIQRLLKSMEQDGLIISGNYNDSTYDRTKWYTMPEFRESVVNMRNAERKNEESIPQNCGMESAKLRNRKCETAEPIPDINTDNKPNIKPDIKPKTTKASFNSSTGKIENLPESIIEKWRVAYPAISIEQEIAKAESWLLANPENRKSNYVRFLTNWMARAQDRAPPGRQGRNRHQSVHNGFDKIDYYEGIGPDGSF